MFHFVRSNIAAVISLISHSVHDIHYTSGWKTAILNFIFISRCMSGNVGSGISVLAVVRNGVLATDILYGSFPPTSKTGHRLKVN